MSEIMAPADTSCDLLLMPKRSPNRTSICTLVLVFQLDTKLALLGEDHVHASRSDDLNGNKCGKPKPLRGRLSLKEESGIWVMRKKNARNGFAHRQKQRLVRSLLDLP